VIVSFNTRDVLRECLACVFASQFDGSFEIFVVDNDSRDGSEQMVLSEFPQVKLLQAGRNRGFGPANNIALQQAKGRYLVLLNSDAFLAVDTLQQAMAHMDADASCGAGGARLIGRNGEWQPSGRCYPTPLLDAFTMLGLAYHFPKSRIFGRMDRTYADQNIAAEVDWVVGAFAIIRADALQKTGFFDERFFSTMRRSICFCGFSRRATGSCTGRTWSLCMWGESRRSSRRLWRCRTPEVNFYYGECAALFCTTVNAAGAGPG